MTTTPLRFQSENRLSSAVSVIVPRETQKQNSVCAWLYCCVFITIQSLFVSWSWSSQNYDFWFLLMPFVFTLHSLVTNKIFFISYCPYTLELALLRSVTKGEWLLLPSSSASQWIVSLTPYQLIDRDGYDVGPCHIDVHTFYWKYNVFFLFISWSWFWPLTSLACANRLQSRWFCHYQIDPAVNEMKGKRVLVLQWQTSSWDEEIMSELCTLNL